MHVWVEENDSRRSWTAPRRQAAAARWQRALHEGEAAPARTRTSERASVARLGWGFFSLPWRQACDSTHHCRGGLRNGGGGGRERRTATATKESGTDPGLEPRPQRVREGCFRKNDGRAVFCKMDAISESINMKSGPIPQQWIGPRKLKNSQPFDYVCTVQNATRLIVLFISPADPAHARALRFSSKHVRDPSSSSATYRLPSFRRTSTPASVVRFLPPLPFSPSSSLPLHRAPPASSVMPRLAPARRDARAGECG
jgi:hypothetical protein